MDDPMWALCGDVTQTLWAMDGDDSTRFQPLAVWCSERHSDDKVLREYRYPALDDLSEMLGDAAKLVACRIVDELDLIHADGSTLDRETIAGKMRQSFMHIAQRYIWNENVAGPPTGRKVTVGEARLALPPVYKEPQYKVREPDDDWLPVDDDWVALGAYSAKDAAEHWAELDDAHLSTFSIAKGQRRAIIEVESPDGQRSLWRVTGALVPEYEAEEVSHG